MNHDTVCKTNYLAKSERRIFDENYKLYLEKTNKFVNNATKNPIKIEKFKTQISELINQSDLPLFVIQPLFANVMNDLNVLYNIELQKSMKDSKEENGDNKDE